MLHSSSQAEEKTKVVYQRYKKRYEDIIDDIFPRRCVTWLLDVCSGNLHLRNLDAGMLGYRDEDIPETLEKWKALIHPSDIGGVEKHLNRLISPADGGETVDLYYRIRAADKTYVWMLSRHIVMKRDGNGRALYMSGILCLMKDLEIKLEDEQIQHERILFALEAARDGLWDWNTKTNEVYYSPRYISMMGYECESFPMMLDSWSSRVHQDDLEHTLYRQLAHVSSPNLGDMFECTYRFLAADGNYRWILGRGKVVSRDENGQAMRIVGMHTDITDLQTTQEALTKIVNHDFLTKLHSRRYFEQVFNALDEEKYPVSVLYVDVDALKLINDTLGHQAGDYLLVTVANILRSNVRASDTVARIGGDEFAILMPGCSGETAAGIVRKIRAVVEERKNAACDMPIYLSIGMASTDRGTPLNLLLNESDHSMLRDKAAHHHENHRAVRAWIENHHGRRTETDRRFS